MSTHITNHLSGTRATLASPYKHVRLFHLPRAATQIWKLPSSLSSVRRGEEGYLRKVALADDVAELLRARNG